MVDPTKDVFTTRHAGEVRHTPKGTDKAVPNPPPPAATSKGPSQPISAKRIKPASKSSVPDLANTPDREVRRYIKGGGDLRKITGAFISMYQRAPQLDGWVDGLRKFQIALDEAKQYQATLSASGLWGKIVVFVTNLFGLSGIKEAEELSTKLKAQVKQLPVKTESTSDLSSRLPLDFLMSREQDFSEDVVPALFEARKLRPVVEEALPEDSGISDLLADIESHYPFEQVIASADRLSAPLLQEYIERHQSELIKSFPDLSLGAAKACAEEASDEIRLELVDAKLERLVGESPELLLKACDDMRAWGLPVPTEAEIVQFLVWSTSSVLEVAAYADRLPISLLTVFVKARTEELIECFWDLPPAAAKACLQIVPEIGPQLVFAGLESLSKDTPPELFFRFCKEELPLRGLPAPTEAEIVDLLGKRYSFEQIRTATLPNDVLKGYIHGREEELERCVEDLTVEELTKWYDLIGTWPQVGQALEIQIIKNQLQSYALPDVVQFVRDCQLEFKMGKTRLQLALNLNYPLLEIAKNAHLLTVPKAYLMTLSEKVEFMECIPHLSQEAVLGWLKAVPKGSDAKQALEKRLIESWLEKFDAENALKDENHRTHHKFFPHEFLTQYFQELQKRGQPSPSDTDIIFLLEERYHFNEIAEDAADLPVPLLQTFIRGREANLQELAEHFVPAAAKKWLSILPEKLIELRRVIGKPLKVAKKAEHTRRKSLAPGEYAVTPDDEHIKALSKAEKSEIKKKKSLQFGVDASRAWGLVPQVSVGFSEARARDDRGKIELWGVEEQENREVLGGHGRVFTFDALAKGSVEDITADALAAAFQQQLRERVLAKLRRSQPNEIAKRAGISLRSIPDALLLSLENLDVETFDQIANSGQVGALSESQVLVISEGIKASLEWGKSFVSDLGYSFADFVAETALQIEGDTAMKASKTLESALRDLVEDFISFLNRETSVTFDSFEELSEFYVTEPALASTGWVVGKNPETGTDEYTITYKARDVNPKDVTGYLNSIFGSYDPNHPETSSRAALRKYLSAFV